MENKIKFLEGVMSPRKALSVGDESNGLDLRTGHDIFPRVALFFSIDIVNSTLYKERTGTWPIIIRSLLDEIRRQVCRRDALQACLLWRVIGDETVFVLPVSSRMEIAEAVSAVFEVTQRISISLKRGKFYDALERQTLSENEISFLKVQNSLSIKAAAWIAVVNNELKNPYDNIVFNYIESAHNTSIREYIGKDIDTGFRLKNYTQDRRLVISLELAYCLLKEGKADCLQIVGYDRLKGVWNRALYPIIWYYDVKKESTCRKEMLDEEGETSFEESFRYDETDGNPLIQKYIIRQNKGIDYYHISGISTELYNDEYILTKDMFEVSYAIEKVIDDRDLKPKTDYIEKLLSKGDTVEISTPHQDPLTLHCAVVCCNVESRAVMIILRGGDHTTNPGKWEFGCAHASSTETIEVAIVEHYFNTYGVKIDLIKDSTRQEKQPIPIAVYELDKGNCIDKGIIFVGKLVDEKEFRSNTGYTERRWIKEDEIDNIKEEEAVCDFHNTLKTIFKHFDEYFEIRT